MVKTVVGARVDIDDGYRARNIVGNTHGLATHSGPRNARSARA